MKKFLVIVFLILLSNNFSYADEEERPKYDKNNFNNNIIKYKWKHTGSFKAQDGIPVQTLKNGQWNLYCAIVIEDTICWLPQEKMSKQKIKLEQCYRCKEQKDTLKLIMFYGKKNFECQDCKRNFKRTNIGKLESYWLPSNEIH